MAFRITLENDGYMCGISWFRGLYVLRLGVYSKWVCLLYIVTLLSLVVSSSTLNIDVTYLTIMRFKRHVPPNLRAYILDTTMS